MHDRVCLNEGWERGVMTLGTEEERLKDSIGRKHNAGKRKGMERGVLEREKQ